MKKLSHYLNESLNNPYKTNIKKIGAMDYEAETTLPDGSYLRIAINGERISKMPKLDSYEIQFSRDGSFAKTDEGDSLRIFATVLDVVKRFVKFAKPDELKFTAAKDFGKNNRERLYKRMGKTLGTKLGFDYFDMPSDTDTSFSLTKKGLLN